MVGAVGLISCFSYLAASRFLRASVIRRELNSNANFDYAALKSEAEALPEKKSPVDIVIAYNKKNISLRQAMSLLKFSYGMKEEDAHEMLNPREFS